MVAAMSFVLFKARFLSIDVAKQSRTNQYPNSNGLKKTEDSRRGWRGNWYGLCARRAPTVTSLNDGEELRSRLMYGHEDRSGHHALD
jgi:hypothetical protein